MDPSGSVADVLIRLDPDYINNILWFDPDPDDAIVGVPQDRTDAYSVLLHELGHALGFNGWRDWSTGTLPGDYMSTYDARVIQSGGIHYFSGAGVNSVYGGAVALTTGNIAHYGNASGPGSDLVATGLMNGVVFNHGTRYGISASTWPF